MGAAQVRSRLLVVAGLIRDPDNRYLLTRRYADAHCGHDWEFPGGKVQTGETPESALVRELHEELGIRVEQSHPWWFVTHSYADFDLVLLLYQVQVWQGQPQPLQSAGMGWFDLSQMLELAMPPADLPIVHRLLA